MLTECQRSENVFLLHLWDGYRTLSVNVICNMYAQPWQSWPTEVWIFSLIPWRWQYLVSQNFVFRYETAGRMWARSLLPNNRHHTFARERVFSGPNLDLVRVRWESSQPCGTTLICTQPDIGSLSLLRLSEDMSRWKTCPRVLVFYSRRSPLESLLRTHVASDAIGLSFFFIVVTMHEQIARIVASDNQW